MAGSASYVIVIKDIRDIIFKIKRIPFSLQVLQLDFTGFYEKLCYGEKRWNKCWKFFTF